MRIRASTRTIVARGRIRAPIDTVLKSYTQGEWGIFCPLSVLVVAVDTFAAFVAFLGFEAEGGDRAGFETGQGDRLAGFLAVAVGALLDPAQRVVDLGDQLALAISGAQLQRTVGFGGGAIGQIRMICGLGR